MEEEYNKKVTDADILEVLKSPRMERDKYENNDTAGVVTGLAWTSVGGDILFIESLVSKGKGAMPILWKKLEVTIWKPTIGKNITTIRSPLAEMRTSSSCVVKIETASRGINIPIRKPVVVTMVAA
jgi:ATP-dependent Lon protease